MPTLSDVYRFINDPSTSITQLREACAIFGLDTSGGLDDLLMRLKQYLAGYSPEAPIPNLETGNKEWQIEFPAMKIFV